MLLFINSLSSLFQASIAPLLIAQTPSRTNPSTPPTTATPTDGFTAVPRNSHLDNLIRTFSSSNISTQDRYRAISELISSSGRFSPDELSQATSPLISLINDRNTPRELLSIAAGALGTVGQGSSQAASALIPLLGHHDCIIQGTAARALGDIGQNSSQVIESLVPLLNSETQYARDSARTSLDRLLRNSSDITTLLTPLLRSRNEDVVLFAAKRLANTLDELPQNIRNQAITSLIPILNSSNGSQRRSAIETLGNIGQNSTEALSELLRRRNNPLFFEDYETTFNAINNILENSDNPNELLASLLDNNNETIRSETVRELGSRSNSPATQAALIRISQNDSNRTVRLLAIIALGRTGNESPAVINTLNNLLNHQDVDIRFAAAQSLVKLGQNTPNLIDTLTSRMGHTESPFSRLLAASTLSEIRGEIPQAVKNPMVGILNSFINDSDSISRRMALGGLVNLGETTPAVMRSLTTLASDNDESLRFSAIQMLRRIRENAPQDVRNQAIEALIPNLNRGNIGTRIATMLSLGRIGQGSSRAASALVSLFNDNDPVIPFIAIRTLGDIRHSSPEICNAILPFLGNDNPNVRAAAAQTLSQITQGSQGEINAFVRALGDSNQDVQTAAANALVRIGKPAVPQMIQQFGNMSSIAVMNILNRIGTNAINDLAGTLNHPNPIIRANAATTIGIIINQNSENINIAPQRLNEIITGITNLATNGTGNNTSTTRDIRIAAIQALGLFGSQAQSAIPPLTGIANDNSNHQSIRSAATEALRLIQ